MHQNWNYSRIKKQNDTIYALVVEAFGVIEYSFVQTGFFFKSIWVVLVSRKNNFKFKRVIILIAEIKSPDDMGVGNIKKKNES